MPTPQVARPDEVGFLGGEVPLEELRCSQPLPGQVSLLLRLTARATRPSPAISFATVFTETCQPIRIADQQDADLR